MVPSADNSMVQKTKAKSLTRPPPPITCGEREQRAKNNTAMESPWVQKLPLKSNQQGTRTQQKKKQTWSLKTVQCISSSFLWATTQDLSLSQWRQIHRQWPLEKTQELGQQQSCGVNFSASSSAGWTHLHWHCTPSCWCPAGDVAGEETVPLNTKNQQLPPLQVPPQTGIFV